MAEGLRKDPAIERWAMMRDHTHIYFRMNPVTIAFAIFTFAILPYGVFRFLKRGKVFLLLFLLLHFNRQLINALRTNALYFRMHN
jgi:hypothetical protein